jgi:hypothetical protein
MCLISVVHFFLTAADAPYIDSIDSGSGSGSASGSASGSGNGSWRHQPGSASSSAGAGAAATARTTGTYGVPLVRPNGFSLDDERKHALGILQPFKVRLTHPVFSGYVFVLAEPRVFKRALLASFTFCRLRAYLRSFTSFRRFERMSVVGVRGSAVSRVRLDRLSRRSAPAAADDFVAFFLLTVTSAGVAQADEALELVVRGLGEPTPCLSRHFYIFRSNSLFASYSIHCPRSAFSVLAFISVCPCYSTR